MWPVIVEMCEYTRDPMTGRGNRLYTFNPQSTIENFTEANYNKCRCGYNIIYI